MIEIKTMDVDNQTESYYTDLFINFGWTLKSSQQIYNQDSHLEERNGDLYSVTKTVNYTKLVFERDTSMPNYRELCRLEEKYHQIYDRLPEKVPPHVENTPESWGKNTKPDVVVKSYCLKIALCGFVLGVVGFIIAARIVYPSDPIFSKTFGGIVKDIFSLAIVGAIVGGIVGFIAGKCENVIARKIALTNPNSKEHKKLVQLHEEAKTARATYDGMINAMTQIREEAMTLLS